MGLPNSQDEDDIEVELRNELEELNRNYNPSSSSSLSSSPPSPYDVAGEGLLDVDTSNKDSYIDTIAGNNDYFSDSIDHRSSISAIASCSNLLSSIPGYEIFKESSELTSASCQATSQIIDSIKHIVGEDIDSENLDSVRCNETDSFPIDPKRLSEFCSTVDNEQGQTSNEVNSDSIICSDITNTIDATMIKTPPSPILQSALKMNYNLTFLSILEDEVEPCNTQQLQKEIEIEAQQEQLRQSKKRNKIIHQRAMDASKERLKCENQSSSARCVQCAFREYRRRKISNQMKAICKGFESLCNTREYLTLKYSFCSWIENTIQKRAGRIILFSLDGYSKRRKQRRKILSDTLCHLMNTMTMRRFFLFWTIYLSTMKLQERLMYRLKSSTITIQNTFRKYQAKCKFKRYQEEYAAIMIQKNFHGYWVRKNLRKENKMIMSRAAILIQKVYRGYSSRTHLNKVMLKNYSYADMDVDKILSGEAIDILDEIFGTMEAGAESSQWKPCKPKRKSVGDVCNAIKLKEESTQIIETMDRSINTATSDTKISSPIHTLLDSECDLKIDQLLRDTTNDTNEGNTNDGSRSHRKLHLHQKEANMNQCKISYQEDEKLMREWNLSDQRVIEVSQNLSNLFCFVIVISNLIY